MWLEQNNGLINQSRPPAGERIANDCKKGIRRKEGRNGGTKARRKERRKERTNEQMKEGTKEGRKEGRNRTNER